MPVFLSAPYPCGYLQGREARSAFIDPRKAIDAAIYSELARIGFRRSGPFVYRPACVGCQACQSARVPVATFRPDRRQRRCLKRNAALTAVEFRAGPDDERYALYQRYLRARHGDGEMDPDDRDGFERFLGASWSDARHVEFRDDGQLIACMIYDPLSDGLSAVYSFFDPAAAARSPGRYMVLWLIEEARRRGLSHVYLGYWIEGCRKMSYKAEYRPLEILQNGSWTAAETAAP